MAIETTLQPRQKWWNILYAVICGGLALWGAYDYWITIPRREADYHAYQASQKRLEELRGRAEAKQALTADEDAEYRRLQAESDARAAKNLPSPTLPPAYDRPVQMWLYIVGCGVLGVPYFLWQWLSVANKRYRLEDDGSFSAPGALSVPADRITDIDMSRWMSKSIATVRLDDGRSVVIDDYKFRNAHLIVGAIASRFYPDDWTADGRDLKRVRALEAAGQPAELPPPPGNGPAGPG